MVLRLFSGLRLFHISGYKLACCPLRLSATLVIPHRAAFFGCFNSLETLVLDKGWWLTYFTIWFHDFNLLLFHLDPSAQVARWFDVLFWSWSSLHVCSRCDHIFPASGNNFRRVYWHIAKQPIVKWRPIPCRFVVFAWENLCFVVALWLWKGLYTLQGFVEDNCWITYRLRLRSVFPAQS